MSVGQHANITRSPRQYKYQYQLQLESRSNNYVVYVLTVIQYIILKGESSISNTTITTEPHCQRSLKYIFVRRFLTILCGDPIGCQG